MWSRIVAICWQTGIKEIVLTGVDITSYGPDIGLGEPGQSGLGLFGARHFGLRARTAALAAVFH